MSNCTLKQSGSDKTVMPFYEKLSSVPWVCWCGDVGCVSRDCWHKGAQRVKFILSCFVTILVRPSFSMEQRLESCLSHLALTWGQAMAKWRCPELDYTFTVGVVYLGIEIKRVKGSSTVLSYFFENGWNHQQDVSGSLLQSRGHSLGQRSEVLLVCVLLGKCGSVPACLAAEKGLTRSVKCSLQAEGIPWVPGPSDNDWLCLCRRSCSCSPASQSCCLPSPSPH